MIKWPFTSPKKETRKQEKEAVERGREAAERILAERSNRLEQLVKQMTKERQAKP